MKFDAMSRLRGATAAIAPHLDRRLILGGVVGASLAITGYAVAVDGQPAMAPTSSGLISQADSVVANQIKTSASNCAAGAPGTVGAAMGTALKVHTEMASVPADVERLFSMADNCFASSSQMYDLSFAIPSLASITSAAQSAIMKFAQKKVCSAIDKVSGVITEPINDALDKIPNLEGFSDINGLVNDGIGGALNQIDPDLGKGYRSAPAGDTYTVSDVFTATQTGFGGGTTPTAPPTTTAPGTPTTTTPQARQLTPSDAPSSGGSLLERMNGLFN